MNLKPIHHEETDLLNEVLEGLKGPQKTISSKFFYDQNGSVLFDQICELDEYYLTRTEIDIMTEKSKEISAAIGNDTYLIELGSGNTKKIRLMLDWIHPAVYSPVDISLEYLKSEAVNLAKDYPELKIVPICADYTKNLILPDINLPYSRKIFYYPGSSIGNFTPEQAKALLTRLASLAGKNGGLVIGIDLKKDKTLLERAYNDKKGITALFNLNMLNHINYRLGADFDLSAWKHRAIYNDQSGRIEMHLVSSKNQIVALNGSRIPFEKDEIITTEYSYKYSVDEFSKLASGVLDVQNVWTDRNQLFSILHLTVK